MQANDQGAQESEVIQAIRAHATGVRDASARFRDALSLCQNAGDRRKAFSSFLGAGLVRMALIHYLLSDQQPTCKASVDLEKLEKGFRELLEKHAVPQNENPASDESAHKKAKMKH